MATYPLPTLAAQISATGISAPAFEDVIGSKVATYQGIYGSDVQLTPDTQDYQAIAAEAAAVNDVNQLAIAVYNSFLPGAAQGAGLSALVQLNGLQRQIPTNSTCVVQLSGVAGTIIPLGVIRDTAGNLWNIPADTEISDSGEVTVTATAQQAGAISAAPGALNTPFTIIGGWQSVTNSAAATPGAPVETDAALRRRQLVSTALPSQSPLSSILSAVANSGGIGRFMIYENQESTPDGNGVPGHSIAVVVEGGDSTAIASVIELKKAPGTGTYGTTSIPVLDPAGLPITINFFEVTEVAIFAAMTIQPLTGYVATTGQAAVAALVAFINALGIGEKVYLNWLLSVAGLNGSALGQTFVITSLTIGLSSGSLAAADIAIAFTSVANCATGNVVLTTL